MNNEEHNDPVWDILKKARKVEVDPFFSRGVCREIRALKVGSEQTNSGRDSAEPKSGRISWLFSPTALVSSLAAAAAVALLLVFLPDSDPSSPSSKTTVGARELAKPTQAEVAEIDNLTYIDDLVAQGDVASLDDEEILALLF